MRRVFRRLIRRVNTTEWSVSWFEVLPGDDPGAFSESLDGTPPPRPQPQADSEGSSKLDAESPAKSRAPDGE